MSKILYLANNELGVQVLQWLVSRGTTIGGVVVHQNDNAKHAMRIVAAADCSPDSVFFANNLHSPETLARIRKLGCDMALSVLFGYILKEEFISLFPLGVLNLHPSFLPFNRGEFPNVWSIVENTPSGVSLHYIDNGIDTGDVIARREVPARIDDTGKTLYTRLVRAAFHLFKQHWPLVEQGLAERLPQSEAGTFHRRRDVELIDQLNLDALMRVGDLLNILRARTFPPYNGAFFLHEGKKYYLRLTIHPEMAAGHPKKRRKQ